MTASKSRDAPVLKFIEDSANPSETHHPSTYLIHNLPRTLLTEKIFFLAVHCGLIDASLPRPGFQRAATMSSSAKRKPGGADGGDRPSKKSRVSRPEMIALSPS